VAKRLSRLETALAGYDNGPVFQQKEEKERQEILQREIEKEKENTETPSSDKDNRQAPIEATAAPAYDDDSSQAASTPVRIPRGLYIHGPVGTGKSMLMDCFFDNVNVAKKQRFHFHNFLAQVHQRIHQLKQRDLHEKGRNFSVDTSMTNNPIVRVGRELARDMSILCLDEFQVTDIADAVILSQLFSTLFCHGTVLVATSNRPPQDLYEGGLNRGYFLPFIDLLEAHCIVHSIQSDQDYRRVLSNCSSFFVKHDEEEVALLIDGLVRDLQVADEAELSVESLQLPVGLNRSIPVKDAYLYNNDDKLPSMARFSFEELCDTDRGAMDYRAVAHAFDIVVLEGIPMLDDSDGHNRARRFITLIDELYEAKCALMCSAMDAETPMDIFQTSRTIKDAKEPRHSDSEATSSTRGEAILWVDVAQEGGTPVGALASVRELSFAFERASSRIFEMCSRSWWSRVLDREK
jgi:predicted ATPase